MSEVCEEIHIRVGFDGESSPVTFFEPDDYFKDLPIENEDQREEGVEIVDEAKWGEHIVPFEYTVRRKKTVSYYG